MDNITKDRWRKCREISETIQHITGTGRALTQGDYNHRRSPVATIVHQELATKYGLSGGKQTLYCVHGRSRWPCG